MSASQPAALEPTRRVTRRGNLSDQIYDDLRERLQRGEFSHQSRLVDVEVAASYGTSRMPAREALLRLVNEGFLTGTTRGFVTPQLTLEDIRDIFEVRRLIEPRAAANAARDLTPEAQQRMAEALKVARSASRDDNVERLIESNMAFRKAWLDCVKNRRLANTIARFVDHVQAVRLGTLRDATTRKIVADGLEALYGAFLRRDPVEAADRMAAFMAAAENAYFEIRKAEIDETALAAGGRRALSRG
jgi:DNA-binding GntR family transcriptional regulator